MTTKFEVNKNVKSDKKRKHKPKSDESGITLEDQKLKLDHRQAKFLYWTYKQTPNFRSKDRDVESTSLSLDLHCR